MQLDNFLLAGLRCKRVSLPSLIYAAIGLICSGSFTVQTSLLFLIHTDYWACWDPKEYFDCAASWFSSFITFHWTCFGSLIECVVLVFKLCNFALSKFVSTLVSVMVELEAERILQWWCISFIDIQVLSALSCFKLFYFLQIKPFVW